MDNNRILRVLNIFFLVCGSQLFWFGVGTRTFRLTIASLAYFVCLSIWYGFCFKQHFTESSIFNFLSELAPVLYKCIRLHLLMGMKVMLFIMFEARYIMRTLNNFIKTLPENRKSNWSWKEGMAYFWLFSGLLWNFGFGIYVMVRMKFLRPTLEQLMHVSAMFIPHFVLGCSVKLQNVASWITAIELQNIRTDIMDICTDKQQKSVPIQIENNNLNAMELSQTSVMPKELEQSQVIVMNLTESLESMGKAVQEMNKVLQKQLLLLIVMNSVCLLGATYSIVYYESTWHLVLQGPIGQCFKTFNIGIYVFIAWDYLCLCAANAFFEREKSKFLEQIDEVLRKEPTVPDEGTKTLLKYARYTLRKKFEMKIFFNSTISLKTFLMVNAVIALAIAVFIIYLYLQEEIDNILLRLDTDGD